MNNQYLYQKLEAINQNNDLLELPEYIKSNLNENINLRDYQEEAFRYFITYYESDLRKNKQIHNLFHMATGERVIIVMGAVFIIKRRV